MEIKIEILIVILMVYLITSGNMTYADETSAGDDEVIEVVETELESNFVSKDYVIEGEDKTNYLVEGGNEKAINLLSTEQNTANGTVIENSNVEGKPYDIEIPNDDDFENKNPLEFRQFITFETKSGKIFHIIVDHGKDRDNVMMLTEVGEQDLLNLIEEQADVEIEIKENEMNELDKLDAEEDLVGDTEKMSEEGSSNNSLIIIGIMSILTGSLGWYFKIYKPKHDILFDDEEIDEADYIDDEDEEDEE